MSVELAIVVGCFFFFLFMGVPIAFVMGLSSVVYFIISGREIFFIMAPEKVFTHINSFVLMAIPFFMLSGEIMTRAGMSDRLVAFSNMVIGRVRGGLAQVNVLASLLFSGITGVALGDIAALGKIFVPAMVKQGYSREFAAAVTAASSIVGPIIPPSIVTVLYAAVMEVSVGALFSAAIIPGLLIGLSNILLVFIQAHRRQYPKQDVVFTRAEVFSRSRDASLAIMMPVIIVGGILGGIFTPTEAAAVSVVYAYIVGTFVLRTIGMRDLWDIVGTAALDSSRLFFIIACAGILSWVFAMENLPVVVQGMFGGLADSPVLAIAVILLFFFVMGLWMEPGPQIILFGPVMGPVAIAAGMDPIQFGITLIVMCMIGLCTPPVGNVLFAISAIVKVRIDRLMWEILPFIGVNLLVVIWVAYDNRLTLTLPRLFGFVD